MIVSVGGEKGGVAKTTVAVNLAAKRTSLGRDVCLFDIDPQRTSTLWCSMRDEDNISPRVESTQKLFDERILSPGLVMRNEIKAMAPRYDDIIMDMGGANNEVLRAAIAMSDLVIFPMKAQSFDMWTYPTLNRLIAESKDAEFKARVIVTQLDPTPLVAAEDLKDCDDFLENFERLSRLQSVIYKRRAWEKANGKGMAIFEYKPFDRKAISEFEAVYEELFHGK